jgi:hypothetical protein
MLRKQNRYNTIKLLDNDTLNGYNHCVLGTHAGCFPEEIASRLCPCGERMVYTAELGRNFQEDE